MATRDNLHINTKIRLEPPKSYRVIILNDDSTPMDFVVSLLLVIFHKEFNEAVKIMQDAHLNGSSTVGVYTYDMAHTKASRAKKEAKKQGFPLEFEVEEV